MIKFILLGILLVFTVHQAFAENVTMTTDSSEFYFLVGENVAVETIVNSSFPNTLTGDIEYTTVITVQQPGLQTVNTNVGNSPVAINPGVEQLLIQFGSYQTETTLQTTLHVTYSDVQEYESRFYRPYNNQNDPVAMSTPNPNPSPSAVCPVLEDIAKRLSRTLSLNGLRYAAVVAPFSNITIPA